MSDKRDAGLSLGVFVLLTAVYVLTFSGRYHASDEISMLAATDSLARRGAWDTDLIRWMGEQQGSVGPDGHLYSRKGIGTTVAALPLYWLALRHADVGNVQAAMLLNAVVTALTGALVYLYVRRLRYSPGVALGTSLAFGLATMAWPYARYLFSEPLAALGVMASAYFLLRYRDRGDAWSLLLAGSGLGIALLARLNNAIVAPLLALVLAAYLYRRHGPPQDAWRRWLGAIVLFGLPVLAALAVTGWYNWLRFGNPLTTGYLPEERFSAPILEGLYGLILSPGKGLLWYNPIFIASLLAWPAFIRRHRVEGWLAAGVLAANVLFYAPWYLWWGGHAWGPRFLVAALPFAALPLAEALSFAFSGRRRLPAAGLVALLLLSFGVQAMGLAVSFNLYLEDVYSELGLYHPATLFNPAYSALLRQVTYLRLGNLDLAWARGGTVDAVALALGLVGVGVAALALAAAYAAQSAPGKWASFLLKRGTVLAGLVVGVAALLILPRYGPTGDVAQAAYILSGLEKPGERAVVADPLLTESFQDAYDGHLPLWGAPSAEPDTPAGQASGIWTVGGLAADPGPARFQVGSVLLTGDDPGVRPLPALTPTSLNLDDRVELIGSDAGPLSVRPGASLPVALQWRALATMSESYTVFVQVIDSQRNKAGQLDRVPCDGSCPTTTWRPGDVVAEWLEVPIRADAPPGRYQVIAGLYDLETGRRLAVRNAGVNDGDDYVLLGEVELRP